MSILYHASPVCGITELEPRVSNHGKAQVYFSSKRENVLVYLSNAIEMHCKKHGFCSTGVWTKWGPYGFDAEGILCIDEYYPNALIETYRGVTGYIYSAEHTSGIVPMPDIPFAYTSDAKVPTAACETIPDAYEAILSAEKSGLLRINRYEDHSEKIISWIERTIKEEYRSSDAKPDYRFFLEGIFGSILD